MLHVELDMNLSMNSLNQLLQANDDIYFSTTPEDIPQSLHFCFNKTGKSQAVSSTAV